jgi:DNA-binding PadR family transcriptional regulator
MDELPRRETIFKGVLSLLVLTLIYDSPMHGYSLKRRVESHLSRTLPKGVIYSTLRRLQTKGLASSRWDHKGVRSRRMYQATARGRKFLHSHQQPLMIVRPIMEGIMQFIKENPP